MTKKTLTAMVMLGRIPTLEKLPAGDFPYREGRDYLLPLRTPLAGPKEYDYSEVTVCIDKVVSSELSKEDLSAYSTERRFTR